MFDFRLQVFHAVAKRMSFTKAAAELFITQPAVTRHIHEIEIFFKVKLFDRNGTRIRLTPAGDILYKRTEEVFRIYRDISFELSELSQSNKGKIRIGASTTIAQYVLPPILAAFHKRFPEIKMSLLINNTEHIEEALLKKEVDMGIIEGMSKKTGIRYSEFVKDEIILVSNSKSPFASRGQITPASLTKIPLLLREPGSGTLEVIAHALKPFKIKINMLQHEMQLGSTESMKLYLMHSNCMAFLSAHSVVKELASGDFRMTKVKRMPIERYFYFILQQGAPEPLMELFIKFARQYPR